MIARSYYFLIVPFHERIISTPTNFCPCLRMPPLCRPRSSAGAPKYKNICRANHN